MATAKQVIDFRASSGFTKAQSDEHQRVRSEKAKEHALETGNYDLTREHLNFQVSKGGKIEPIDKSKSIPAIIAENLLARGIEDPNAKNPERRYRTVVNFILGGSRERMHEIAFGNQKVNLDKGADNSGIRRTKDIEHWAQDMYQFMCDRYGEDNVVAFYVHLDELNPHVHCTVLPITQDNKFSYKKIFAGKDKFEHRRRTLALHDALAKVNEKWGLGRGTSISETGARHRSTEEYRRHLEQECSNLQESIINHKRALSDLIVEMQLAEKRSKGLTTMIENLEKQKGDIEKELDNLRKQIRNTNGDKTYLQLQKDKLEKNLNDINSKLADKQAKLENADQKLTQLKADYDEIKQRADELKEEARASAVTVQKNIHTELTCALYENVVSDFKMRLPVLDKSLLKAFEDSPLLDIAENGNNIVNCATLLVAGYVDQAVTFAQTHGGGGGGCSQGWGRNPEDDDREWARRCAAMAVRLMKSGSGNKIKR